MVSLRGQIADGVLALLGGGADVTAVRQKGGEADRAEVVGPGLDHVLGDGGLAEQGDLAGLRKVVSERLRVLCGLDHADTFGSLAQNANDFVVPFGPDQGDGEATCGVGAGFGVDFGDKGAGGVDDA